MTTSHVFQTEGIVLKRKNIGETDRIITIFTRSFGKIACIAKGVRKITSRRSGHVEVFHRAHISFYEGKGILYGLTEAQTLDAHQGLSGDILSVSYAYYICELVDTLTADRQKHEDVYILLSNSLTQLDTCVTNKERTAVVCTFARLLLRVLGFLPEHEILKAEYITPFVEKIIERKLRVPRVMHLLSTS
jgi:DNA repair protein RecO (recombination protein O)